MYILTFLALILTTNIYAQTVTNVVQLEVSGNTEFSPVLLKQNTIVALYKNGDANSKILFVRDGQIINKSRLPKWPKMWRLNDDRVAVEANGWLKIFDHDGTLLSSNKIDQESVYNGFVDAKNQLWLVSYSKTRVFDSNGKLLSENQLGEFDHVAVSYGNTLALARMGTNSGELRLVNIENFTSTDIQFKTDHGHVENGPEFVTGITNISRNRFLIRVGRVTSSVYLVNRTGESFFWGSGREGSLPEDVVIDGIKLDDGSFIGKRLVTGTDDKGFETRLPVLSRVDKFGVVLQEQQQQQELHPVAQIGSDKVLCVSGSSPRQSLRLIDRNNLKTFAEISLPRLFMSNPVRVDACHFVVAADRSLIYVDVCSS